MRLVALTLVALSGSCDALVGPPDADPGFVFDVSVNDYSGDFSGGVYEITIDGVLLADPRAGRRTEFDSVEQANIAPVVIETWLDGEVVHSCRLYGDACRGRCETDRTTSTVCVNNEGEIHLNTWDCPCDDSVGDWFCGGDCADTAP